MGRWMGGLLDRWIKGGWMVNGGRMVDDGWWLYGGWMDG